MLAAAPRTHLSPESWFTKIDCSICHATTLRTAPAGSVIDGEKLIVSANIGDKDFNPYSDYLLHDVGTGSVQQGTGSYLQHKPEKFRTSPLWGVRHRSWMMHDGKAITYHQVIMRHSGEASQVIQAYTNLTLFEMEQLRLFLDLL